MRNVCNFHKVRKCRIKGFAIYSADARHNAGKGTGINLKGSITMRYPNNA
jgi:hypothetical protein